MTSTLLTLRKNIKLLDYKNIYQLGSLLNIYSKSNNYDWRKYINNNKQNPFNYNKKLFTENNIECNLINISRHQSYDFTSKYDTSFLVVKGCVNNVCVEKNINYYKYNKYIEYNNIGYIFKNEKYNLINKNYKDSSILLTLSKNDDINDTWDNLFLIAALATISD